jgi:hypothetical protein
LFAHDVVTIGAQTAGVVTGGSWVAITVGVVLILTAIARQSAGPGVFPLTGGIAALVAQAATHWLDAPAVHEWQPGWASAWFC